MRKELGEVGLQSICVLVDPEVAKQVQPGDEVSFPMGSWTVEGKVVSVAVSSLLIDSNRVVIDVEDGGSVRRTVPHGRI